MATKHYIVSLHEMYLEGFGHAAFGTIVSSHLDEFVALEMARDLNRVKGFIDQPGFAVVSHETRLRKGAVHPNLAHIWLAEKYDRDAMSTMKDIIDPTWRRQTPVTTNEVAWSLDFLNLGLEELRFRYGERASVDLEQATENRSAVAARSAQHEDIRQAVETDRSAGSYCFPAIVGTRAGRSYYAAQVSYHGLVRLFDSDESGAVPVHLRARSLLDERCAEDIAAYIIKNRNDYTLPAITANVSTETYFEPIPFSGGGIGRLHIPFESKRTIHDGQHRRRGIQIALKRDPTLRDETIVVAIYIDRA